MESRAEVASSACVNKFELTETAEFVQSRAYEFFQRRVIHEE
jgi:hypothetical protein